MIPDCVWINISKSTHLPGYVQGFLAISLVKTWWERNKVSIEFNLWWPFVSEIDPSHKSHNALNKYPIMHYFVTEMCTHVYISVTKWCIVGYGNGALWICATCLLACVLWTAVLLAQPVCINVNGLERPPLGAVHRHQGYFVEVTYFNWRWDICLLSQIERNN